MQPYQITHGTPQQRERIAGLFPGLAHLPSELAAAAVTAWVSVWTSSKLADLLDAPSLPPVPEYRLVDHTNEVFRIGLDLANTYERQWNRQVDRTELVASLLLHDVDKPLLYRIGPDGNVIYTPLSKQLPHGVIGAMLLRELGFSHDVVSVVATHALNAPFHGLTPTAFILHYADMFATDRVQLDHGIAPFYQRMHLS